MSYLLGEIIISRDNKNNKFREERKFGGDVNWREMNLYLREMNWRTMAQVGDQIKAPDIIQIMNTLELLPAASG